MVNQVCFKAILWAFTVYILSFSEIILANECAALFRGDGPPSFSVNVEKLNGRIEMAEPEFVSPPAGLIPMWALRTPLGKYGVEHPTANDGIVIARQERKNLSAEYVYRNGGHWFKTNRLLEDYIFGNYFLFQFTPFINWVKSSLEQSYGVAMEMEYFIIRQAKEGDRVLQQPRQLHRDGRGITVVFVRGEGRTRYILESDLIKFGSYQWLKRKVLKSEDVVPTGEEHKYMEKIRGERNLYAPLDKIRTVPEGKISIHEGGPNGLMHGSNRGPYEPGDRETVILNFVPVQP